MTTFWRFLAILAIPRFLVILAIPRFLVILAILVILVILSAGELVEASLGLREASRETPADHGWLDTASGYLPCLYPAQCTTLSYTALYYPAVHYPAVHCWYRVCTRQGGPGPGSGRVPALEAGLPGGLIYLGGGLGGSLRKPREA